MNTIDYGLLAHASQLYLDNKFVPIEVPWRVSESILNITKPADADSYIVQGTNKGLLASGEQGFLYLMNKGILPPGLYQTITPCFRNETYDETHSKQFMKLELIHIFDHNEKWDIQEMIQDMAELSLLVMRTLVPSQVHNAFDIVKVHNIHDPLAIAESMDINCAGIEVGSYGARSHPVVGSWIYGTGLALPRFSKAVKMFQKNI